MEVMGYEEREKENVVARGKTTNVKGGTMHGIIICKGCMSLEMQRSHDNEYVLFKSIKPDDPLIKKIGEVVGNFII